MLDLGPEPLGDFGHRADEVASLVQRVDQRRANHAFGRIGKQNRGLTLEMVAKRHRLRDISFEVRGLAGVGARRRRPSRRSRSRCRPERTGSPARCDPHQRCSRPRCRDWRQGGPRPSPAPRPPNRRVPALLRRSLRLGLDARACSRLASSRSSARSSSGLLANSFSMNCVSSRFGICNSLIACRSCGVRTIA